MTKKRKECNHQFWKDRNPNTCFNCGKTEEDLFQNFLAQVRKEGYLKGKTENIMAVDKKVIKNFNKALKDETSDLVKMIKDTAKKEVLEDLPNDETFCKHDEDMLTRWKNKKLKESGEK